MATTQDSTGLIDMDAGMESLNKITSSDSPLIEKARTDGMQFANARGMANSSMAAQATQSAAYDAALPVWENNQNSQLQRDLQSGDFAGRTGLLDMEQSYDKWSTEYQAQHDKDLQSSDFTGREGLLEMEQAGNKELQAGDFAGRGALQDDAQASDQALQAGDFAGREDLMVKETQMNQDFDAWKTEYLAGHDLEMLNTEFEGKANLVNIEQEWNQLIQGDINAATFYGDSMDGVLDILNNKDLNATQQANALDLYLGSTTNGVYTPGVMGAGLEYINSLNGGTAPAPTTLGGNTYDTTPWVWPY